MNLSDLISYLIENAVELFQMVVWFTALSVFLNFVINQLGALG